MTDLVSLLFIAMILIDFKITNFFFTLVPLTFTKKKKQTGQLFSFGSL